jgi:hypothetical protein
MNTITRLSLLLSPLLIVACAATALPAREFPPGARAPSAAELGALLRGKTTSTPTPDGIVRAEYAAQAHSLEVYAAGRSDTGTWRVEDGGKICFELKTFSSSCGEIRLVGQDIYMRRASGEVVQVTVLR